MEKKVEENNIPTHTSAYYDSFQYTGDNGVLKLDFFSHAEGTVNLTYTDQGTVGYNYAYHYTDHLGNIRLRYGVDPNDGIVKILEESHYYPFGLQHEGYNRTRQSFKGLEGTTNIILTPVDPFLGDSYQYGFGSKERQEELGLQWQDFGARNYDPALGRWMNLDPLAEQMRRHSPYNYAFNNPLVFTDPNGMAPQCSTCNNEHEKNVDEVGRYIPRNERKGEESAGCPEVPCNDTSIYPNTAGEQQINGVVVTASKSGVNLSNSGYTNDDYRVRRKIINGGGVIARALLANEDNGIFISIYDSNKPFEGFAEEFAAGWKNWDKKGLGNFLMNTTAYGVGGAMALPLLSTAGASSTVAELANVAVDGYVTTEVYASYYYTLGSSTTSSYIGGVGASFFSKFGELYIKKTPPTIRKLLFNKSMYRFFNKPNLDKVNYFNKGLEKGYQFLSKDPSFRIFNPFKYD